MQSYRTHREIICIRLENYCNLSCRGCLSDSGPNRKPVSIKEEKIFRLLSCLERAGVRKISYSGGEPLLIPNLNSILQTGADLRLSQIVTTNGTLPLQAKINKELIEYAKISLWGDARFYREHFSENLYRKICSNITQALQDGFTLGLNIVVSASVMPELDKILIHFMEKWPSLDNIVLQGYLPVDHQDAWTLTSEQKAEIVSLVNNINTENKKTSMKFLDLQTLGDTYITVDQEGNIELQSTQRTRTHVIGNLFSMPEPEFSDLLDAMWQKKYLPL